MPAPGYILALLLTLAFTLATWLQPHAINWNRTRAKSDNLLNIVMGDARRLFANHFFIKSDEYFHSGYYPSIFDQGRTKEVHIAEQASAENETGHDHKEHEEGMDFLQPPHDWIEAFGRNFFNTEHTHLDEGGKVAEMLPWLRISAELNPQRVDTYTVAAYWLRGPMKHPKEAEAFLREGQRANPDSYEILFELGRLYRDNYHNPDHARNLFELAEQKLEAQEKKTGQPDLLGKRQILVSLSRLEEEEGNLPEAIRQLERLRDAFPPENKADRQKFEEQILELQHKLNAGKSEK